MNPCSTSPSTSVQSPLSFTPASKLTSATLESNDSIARDHAIQVEAALTASNDVPAYELNTIDIPAAESLCDTESDPPSASASSKRRCYGLRPQLQSWMDRQTSNRRNMNLHSNLTSSGIDINSALSMESNPRIHSEGHSNQDHDDHHAIIDHHTGTNQFTQPTDSMVIEPKQHTVSHKRTRSPSISSAAKIINTKDESEEEQQADMEMEHRSTIPLDNAHDPLESSELDGEDRAANVEVNALESEADFERSANTFEAKISGIVGFNTGMEEATKLIQQLKEAKKDKGDFNNNGTGASTNALLLQPKAKKVQL